MDDEASFYKQEVNESLLVDFTNSSTKIQATGGNVTSVEDYCGPTWAAIGLAYGHAHGFTSLLICLFGCFLNLLNLIVLTRRGMISPTNVILTGLALADMLNMTEYIPFALFMKVLKRPGYPPKTYGWALFVLIHSNFSQVSVSIYSIEFLDHTKVL